MEEKIIFDKKPAVLELEAGTYHWCACGRSDNQPFCDGSHAGSGINPVKFELDTLTKIALCNCKHTCKEPRCDGSHSKL